ncbi:hypothetical protein PR048_017170 [Dryococelus australis]|uniref:Uncharacterized protein n=1 Tax=Dryococelus australis TaxID=614101 RepID=A0ABQ9H8T8_9NEOP|nr:hypothetical protein PR048_017170 [Dryococelus australis]
MEEYGWLDKRPPEASSTSSQLPTCSSSSVIWSNTQFGIIGPYFSEDGGPTVTVTSDRFVAMIGAKTQ